MYICAHNDTAERVNTNANGGECTTVNKKKILNYGWYPAFIVVWILTDPHSTGKVTILGDVISRKSRIFVNGAIPVLIGMYVTEDERALHYRHFYSTLALS